MNRISELPNLNWSDIARRQIAITGAELVGQSLVAYRIRDIASAGLIYQSLIGVPWFWFLLAKGVTLRDLIDFRRLKDFIPSGSLTAVESGNAVEERFASLYGFEWTEEVAEHQGIAYKIYRRI